MVGFKRDAWNGLAGRHSVYTGLAAVPDTYAYQPWNPQQTPYHHQQMVQTSQQLQLNATPGVVYTQAPPHPQQHITVAPNPRQA